MIRFQRLLQKQTVVRSFSGISIISPHIGLVEEQISFYDLAKAFAQNELFPYAGFWDEKGCFPLNTYKKFATLGFGGVCISEEYGGSGLSRWKVLNIIKRDRNPNLILLLLNPI